MSEFENAPVVHCAGCCDPIPPVDVPDLLIQPPLAERNTLSTYKALQAANMVRPARARRCERCLFDLWDSTRAAMNLTEGVVLAMNNLGVLYLDVKEHPFPEVAPHLIEERRAVLDEG